MKKAYKITPQKFQQNCETISRIEYKYGSHIPETMKKGYDKIKAQNAEFEKPDKSFFYMENEFVYNLYLNRNEDEPVTSRELYAIVNTLLEKTDSMIRTATWGM